MGAELQKVFGESAPSEPTICKCYKLFLEGRTSIKDDKCSRRPSTATVEDKVEEVHQLLSRDQQQMCEELAGCWSVYWQHLYHPHQTSAQAEKVFQIGTTLADQ